MESAEVSELRQLRWQHRILVCQLADRALGERLLASAAAEAKGFAERDLLLYLILNNSLLRFPKRAPSLSLAELRGVFDEPAQASSCVLIGKDGGRKRRVDRIPSFSEVFSWIDAMPMRRREMQEQ